MWQLSPQNSGGPLYGFQWSYDMTRLELLKSLSKWIMGNESERQKIEARIPL